MRSGLSSSEPPATGEAQPPIREAAFWDDRYRRSGAGQVSWAQRSPSSALDAMAVLGVPHGSSVIDVGGGASPLASSLVGRGHDDVTVLDISKDAIAQAKAQSASGVQWIAADLLAWRPARRYDVWHDRALFHFLIEEEDRTRYRMVLDRALAPGGYVIVETFAENGPDRCSGLPVRRYRPQTLRDALSPVGLRLECHGVATHTTPHGSSQEFIWAGLRRTADATCRP